ncbi:MAG TPA: hypothetical protein H9684_01505 [Firmicutes bacterium]|nr:hypothetical protein [Bacillota bacterium]
MESTYQTAAQAAAGQEAPPARAAADSFACPGCGARMAFDPDTQSLLCAQCGRTVPVPAPELEAPEYLYNPETDEYSAPDWNAAGQRTVACTGCGAKMVVDGASLTARCPFCGGHYVVQQDAETRGILPETMMPFRISRPKAEGIFRQWVKKRFWAPGDFRRTVTLPDGLSGVYLPFWTYDVWLDTAYRGEGGRRYTVTRTRTVNGRRQTYTVTEVRWYPISGADSLAFDDRSACASRAVEPALLQKLGAFSTKVLRRYHPAYLAGFGARRYDLGLGEGFAQVRPGMERDMQNKIERDCGYDCYRGMQYSHRFSNVRFKHILLPVWMAAYPYKNKVYRFLINGETGRTAGKSPVSPLKVLLAAGIGLLAAALLFLLWRLL